MFAPHQAVWAVLGALALYALIAVMVTTQKKVKRKLGFRTWKNIHLISYGTALLFIVHGVVMDPELKDRPVDWLDIAIPAPAPGLHLRIRNKFQDRRCSGEIGRTITAHAQRIVPYVEHICSQDIEMAQIAMRLRSIEGHESIANRCHAIGVVHKNIGIRDRRLSVDQDRIAVIAVQL